MSKTDRNRRRRQRRRARTSGLARNSQGVLTSRRRVQAQLVQPVRRQVRPIRRRNRRRRTSLLGNVGATVGGLFGGVGSRVGRAVGNGISRIFGRGDYVLSNPVRVNSLAASTPPQFGNESGLTRIRHREYITDLFSTETFGLQTYPLNPGMPALFPWLSTIASQYEQYRFMGLVIEFKSTSSNALNSTNTALGVVGLCTQYDAAEPDFVNKQEFENYQGAQNANPSQCLLHFVECAPNSNPLERMYVRHAALPANQDIKFYDYGKVSFLTQGMQEADVNIGELWVSYDIEFSKPKLPTGGLTADFGIDFYSIPGYDPADDAFNPSATVPIKPVVSNVGSTLTGTVLGNFLTIPSSAPRGSYMLMCLCRPPTYDNTKVFGFSAAASLTNCVLKPWFGHYNFGNQWINSTAVDNTYFLAAVDIQNSGDAVINWAQASGSTDGYLQNVQIYVIPLPLVTPGDSEPGTGSLDKKMQLFFKLFNKFSKQLESIEEEKSEDMIL